MFQNANALIDLADDNDRLLAENQELRLRLIVAEHEIAAMRAQLATAERSVTARRGYNGASATQ